MTVTDVRAMLARRPESSQTSAFGHVDVSQKGRAELSSIVSDILKPYVGKNKQEEVPFHADDQAEDHEVLVAPLAKFDEHYQVKAPWSIERAAEEIRAAGLPEPLTAANIANGHWSFYAIRVVVASHDVVAIRAKSPTYGLAGHNKLVTKFVGSELKPVTEPLLAFDRSADILVVDKKVYVISPRNAERLLVDAEVVKKRAPKTAKKFRGGLQAKLADPTALAIERVCSRNAFAARRVERLVAEGALSNVTAAEVRAALPESGLPKDSFGKTGPLRADSDDAATILIEIAADLYYQPRFASPARRVGSYRAVK